MPTPSDISALRAVLIGPDDPEIIFMFVCVTSLGIALQANFDIRLLTLGAALARRALPSAGEGDFTPAPHMPQPSMSAPPSGAVLGGRRCRRDESSESRPSAPPSTAKLSLADAVALVERVRLSAARGARESLEALATAVAVPIAGISLRVCPELPPTVEERITDNRAQTYARIARPKALARSGAFFMAPDGHGASKRPVTSKSLLV